MAFDFGALAGGFVGKAVDVWSAREAAKDDRAFARDMSSTAYQRATADMRAAGINPALAYMQGGASTPTSSQDSGGSMASHVASAVQMQRVKAEVDLLKSQKHKTDAEAALTSKTMPPADPWRILYELVGKQPFSSARSAGRYISDTVKTFPLVPQTSAYRQALQPVTERQREQMRKQGYYTRPARKH